MTRRRAVGLGVGIVLLGVGLAAGAGRTTDADTRRIYLLAIMVLYTIAVVVWILLAILVKVLPDAQGQVERHLRPREPQATIPEEVTDLLTAIQKGRRSYYQFELLLRPRMDSLHSGAPLRPGRSVVRPPKGFARLRRGPSAKKLAAMLDRIEER